MDLLKDPSFRLKYQKSKLKVKLWESEFRKTHGRNPSKVVQRLFISPHIVDTKMYSFYRVFKIGDPRLS